MAKSKEDLILEKVEDLQDSVRDQGKILHKIDVRSQTDKVQIKGLWSVFGILSTAVVFLFKKFFNV